MPLTDSSLIVNLGKWVLRNLFSKLIDEEMRRDAAYRSTLQNPTATPSSGLVRPGAPTSITMPESLATAPMVSPGTVTPRASNGYGKVPPTPTLAIGAATPGFAPLSATLPPTAEEESAETTTNGVPPHPQATPAAMSAESQSDYFSNTNSTQNQSEASSESNKFPETPGGTAISADHGTSGTVSTPTSPTEEKKKGLFGKKFPTMGFPKKLTASRTSAEVKPSEKQVAEEKSDTASYKSSEKEEKVIEDNFFGVVQKIRQEYDEQFEGKPGQPIPAGITPSTPLETPVLNPPPHTTIIIQEDNPESGGLADQYRGEISEVGNEADMLEKIAPSWLGEFLLKVCHNHAYLYLLCPELTFPNHVCLAESNSLQGDREGLIRAATVR